MDVTGGESSFKSYSKVDEQAEEAYRRKSHKRCIIVVVSAFILVAIIIAVLVASLVPNSNKKSKNDNLSSSSSSESIKAMCNVTIYPNSCYSSMSSGLKSSFNSTHPQDLFVLSLNVALNELKNLSSLPQKIISSPTYSNQTNDPLLLSALQDCETLFRDAIDQISESIATVETGEMKIDDIRTWLSTAITDQETCIEGLKETKDHLNITQEVKSAMANSTEFTSNCLAIATKVMATLDDLNITIHRKVLGDYDYGFPNWVHRRDRRLLVEDEENPKPNITVALDGSGDFETLIDAVKAIPKRRKSRFVIYVKEGLYLGNVTVDKDCWHVMIYGDGMNKTIISASQNAVDGVSTFSTGTFIAGGRGFIAKDMGFRNTAGPHKDQAVALRSSSDNSIFYRCSFAAYQDTLYTHTNRQFYRDCLITGTVDFIFGNAAVIFQNCTIQPRQPLPAQFNTITAQGKSDPNQNTGISIQRCQLTPLDYLTAPTYLGRPWRDYATTVIMQSYIGEFLDRLGWAEWEADVNTVYYAEFRNVGPGSATDRRVKWAGVRRNITYQEAEEFTVDPFIQGSQWLPQARITYDETF